MDLIKIIKTLDDFCIYLVGKKLKDLENFDNKKLFKEKIKKDNPEYWIEVLTGLDYLKYVANTDYSSELYRGKKKISDNVTLEAYSFLSKFRGSLIFVECYTHTEEENSGDSVVSNIISKIRIKPFDIKTYDYFFSPVVDDSEFVKNCFNKENY